jgi:hypothetical protein
MIDGRMPIDELPVEELLDELEKVSVNIELFRKKFNREKYIDPNMRNHLVRLLEFQILHKDYKSMSIGSETA